MLVLFSIYTMLHQKMPLSVQFAYVILSAHCHCGTAELVFIHKRERNTSAECSPSLPCLAAWIHFVSSLHLLSRIASLRANIQAKLGWSWRYRRLAHEVFSCTIASKAIASWGEVANTFPLPKNPSPDKGVLPDSVQHTQTKRIQASRGCEIREGKQNVTSTSGQAWKGYLAGKELLSGAWYFLYLSPLT